MKWILLITFILVVGFSVSSQNSIEISTANSDNGGTTEFVEEVKNSNGEWVENAGNPIFDNKVVASLFQKPSEEESTEVLGSHIAADESEKWIEVDLSDFRLYAWEGNRKVYSIQHACV